MTSNPVDVHRTTNIDAISLFSSTKIACEYSSLSSLSAAKEETHNVPRRDERWEAAVFAG